SRPLHSFPTRRSSDLAYVEPDQPVDPSKDKRINAAFYGVVPAVDGSIWGSVLGFPGAIVRLVPGSNPSATALAEIYELPWDNPRSEEHTSELQTPYDL